jgi:hypothetical protein
MATTGRETVGPGQVIGSDWGNDVWDQSVQCFDSAADRDTQYPSPHAGSLAWLNDSHKMTLHNGTAWQNATALFLNQVGVPYAGSIGILTATSFPVSFVAGDATMNLSGTFSSITHAHLQATTSEPVGVAVRDYTPGTLSFFARDLNAVAVNTTLNCALLIIGVLL